MADASCEKTISKMNIIRKVVVVPMHLPSWRLIFYHFWAFAEGFLLSCQLI